MVNDTSSGNTSFRWRRVSWIVVVVAALAVVGSVLSPEIATVVKERIALVRIEGPILDSRSAVDELDSYAQDPLVKAIVLRIDSPGGGVAASQEIYNAVKRVREEKQKTVVASMGTVAASGGYYVAVASDRILANPGTLTGQAKPPPRACVPDEDAKHDCQHPGDGVQRDHDTVHT